MKSQSIKKVTTEYISHRPRSDYESVHFIVNHEVEDSDHIQVRHDVADRWRSTEDAIQYYEWVIQELKKLRKELKILPNEALQVTSAGAEN
jgi:ppGpp synthetase/RelA/SpoT-type nucleotidyltranferase